MQAVGSDRRIRSADSPLATASLRSLSLIGLVQQFDDRLARVALCRRKRRNMSFCRLLKTMFIACRCCCG